ncbi:MAG TPA: response regulator transcription factor [Gemmatimonadales bacterium]|nr:response regulator transcription factor [Gemmatimonadales bacterium]
MIRVLIVAHIRLYREGLAQVLAHEPSLFVVGMAADREAAVAAAETLKPDVLLLDLAMAESRDLVCQLQASGACVKVVAIGLIEAEGEVLSCAEVGVAGYVPREGSLEDLVEAVESVGRGELLCSPQIAGTLLRRIAALARERGPELEGPRLTLREREIVGLIDRGLSNKDIARQLCIEVATVKNHVHNILEKLSVRRRGEAAAKLRGRVNRASAAAF